MNARQARLPPYGAASLLVAVAALALPAASSARQTATAQGPRTGIQESAEAVTLLDVPFVAQTEALCGGAAIAMVLRYWGRTGVDARDFAPLLDESAAGIATTTLVAAVRERGWRALPLRGDAPEVRRLLSLGRPVIALLQDRPGRFHYVVVVAWARGRVLIHDPARGPFRSLSKAEFLEAWAPAGRWALLVLPSVATGPRAAAATTTDSIAVPIVRGITGSGGDCAPLVRAAVDTAGAGDLDAAAATLATARDRCPEAAAPVAELAGVRFRQQRYQQAAELAGQAAALDPEDPYAWKLLGAALYVLDDPEGALKAWNHAGEPTNDLTVVEGLSRTRTPVALHLIDIESGDRITPDGLRRARRRLETLPAAFGARVEYSPLGRGRARVHAIVVERPLLPLAWTHLAAMAARAAVRRRIDLTLAGPAGAGEAWTVGWSWLRNRPALSLDFRATGVLGMPWLWTVHVARETETFARPAMPRETRRTASIEAADWSASGTLRWSARGRVDDWAGRHRFTSLGAGLQIRPAGNRLAVHVDADGWLAPTATDASFASASAGAALRSPTTDRAPQWVVRGDIAWAGPGAPADMWPGAGTGPARPFLLRAHPLLDDDGSLRGGLLGRRVVHGTAELTPWIATIGPARLGAAAFLDAAATDVPLATDGLRSAADLGLGLRIALPGAPGTLRLDFARSLTDAASAFSLGWMPAWPGW